MIRGRNFPLLIFLSTVGLALLVWSVAGCGQAEVSKLYEHGVVATVSPPAAEIGRQVFEMGGNAFDVAVAVGLALAVTYPPAGNLGGGGYAVVRDGKSGVVMALDFRERAPGAATDTMYLDSAGQVIPGLSTMGGLACGVPGSVAGLHALSRRYGTIPWSDLVTLAARLADSGFVVDAHLAAEFAAHVDDLAAFDETRAAYAPEGHWPQAGDRLVLPELAATLYALAAEGPEVFYSGSVAEKIAATVQKHGGIMTHEDLENYRVIWRNPVFFPFDSFTVYSMPPSSSGGIVLGQILKLVEPYDFGHYTADSPEYIHLFAEASRLAYADRSKHLGDPDYWAVPPALLDDKYLTQRRARISLDHAGNSNEVEPGNPARYESEQTTHYSVCDADGNLVAVTYTLNTSFGSCLAVEGAGFLLNNEMDDFSLKPGFANTYGLVGAEANRIEGGKRMLSSMAPTIVLQNDRPYLVLGSPGGSKIPTTVAQAIIDITRFNMTPDEAVRQPRVHHQWLPDVLYLEADRYDDAVIQRLVAYGYQVKERSAYGDLEMVMIDPVSGLMSGASDPRSGGAVVGY